MIKDKLILDACCGSRMFWHDKQNPYALFMDNRNEVVQAKDSSSKSGIRTIEVNPGIVADFTKMPFEDGSFYMVIFDPPHLKTLGKTSWMAKKYGKLEDDWKEVLEKGFSECFRVLKPYGTLVFKWNEYEIPIKDVLSLTPVKPIILQKQSKQSKTHWITFMKLPNQI